MAIPAIKILKNFPINSASELWRGDCNVTSGEFSR